MPNLIVRHGPHPGSNPTHDQLGGQTSRRWAGGVAVLFSVLLVILGFLRRHALTGTTTDQHVLEWMIARRSPGLSVAAVAVTDAASPAVVATIAVTLAGLVWLATKSIAMPLLLIGTVLAASAASTTLKVLVGTQRPPHAVQLVTETDHAFPSGHVAGSLTLLGMAAVIVDTEGRRMLRITMAIAVSVAVTVIAVTRLYLGVHWLTDVVGGLLLGALSITGGYLAAGWLPGPGIDVRSRMPNP